MEIDYRLGELPSEVQDLIIRDIDEIQGTWRERQKRKDEVLAMLQRLGVGGIKRRLVVNAESLFEIRKEWPVKQINESQLLQEDNALSPRSATEASTEPSSPVRGAGSVAESKWWQKQHFPAGRFVEGAICVNSNEAVEIVDPETGPWSCTAKIAEGVFYQKRTSEKHQVTMYETRALVRRRIDEGDKKEQDNKPLQYFQWVLQDHRSGNNILRTHFYLEKV
ncbi:hypothetical protein GNI_113450 [Gregarina niphandrodes]|uniref:Uncharacterized protein n=1 Tax=Gregarina niphandrodes TaxID=110365 RepID=A0A023B382_GRENI|nr:hypothetical protein GNI_113450 [Gregarina niphandrodes]EZG55403.1 hypothetical protein GNI_113450 [Gregarina niphandrodes]|eukprot:XP_011131577.1 hypothetical protein GNI_113450 [Gregarina niphandrodes]